MYIFLQGQWHMASHDRKTVVWWDGISIMLNVQPLEIVMCSELLWSELHQAVAIALDGYYSNKEGKLNVQRADDIINIRSLIDNIIDPDCLVQELIIYLGSMSSGWRLGFWKRAHGQLHQQLSELINIYQQQQLQQLWYGSMQNGY